ncbi:MAG: flagellar hook-length control protein FliK [Pseudomonadota bacterium]
MIEPLQQINTPVAPAFGAGARADAQPAENATEQGSFQDALAAETTQSNDGSDDTAQEQNTAKGDVALVDTPTQEPLEQPVRVETIPVLSSIDAEPSAANADADTIAMQDDAAGDLALDIDTQASALQKQNSTAEAATSVEDAQPEQPAPVEQTHQLSLDAQDGETPMPRLTRDGNDAPVSTTPEGSAEESIAVVTPASQPAPPSSLTRGAKSGQQTAKPSATEPSRNPGLMGQPSAAQPNPAIEEASVDLGEGQAQPQPADVTRSQTPNPRESTTAFAASINAVELVEFEPQQAPLTPAATPANKSVLDLNLAKPAPEVLVQVPQQRADMAAKQVGLELAKQARQGDTHFTVRMDPPELGKLDVRLTISKAGDVQAHIVVEREATLELLHKDVRALERGLNDAGLKTDQNAFSLNLKQQSNEGFGGSAETGIAAAGGSDEDGDLVDDIDGATLAHIQISSGRPLDVRV